MRRTLPGGNTSASWPFCARRYIGCVRLRKRPLALRPASVNPLVVFDYAVHTKKHLGEPSSLLEMREGIAARKREEEDWERQCYATFRLPSAIASFLPTLSRWGRLLKGNQNGTFLRERQLGLINLPKPSGRRRMTAKLPMLWPFKVKMTFG